MALPKVLVIVTGGTITMAPSASGGIVPSLSGDDLVAQVPALAAVAELTVETPFLKPGAALTIADLAGIASRIRAAAGTLAGVVVVQGTDTIDETSFVLDLLHAGAPSVVVTGAMRGAAAPGADGPANLLAAVRVAASPDSRGRGVLVVLNDEIHAACVVEKMHKALPSAFASPGAGPAGLVAEDAVRFHAPAPSDRPPAFEGTVPAPVAIIKLGLDDDDRLLAAAPGLGYRGVVIEGMGAGHVPAQLVPGIAALVERVPVVLASRVPGGPIFTRTYAFPGSERDLVGRGLVPAGRLSPHKARLLLALCLGSGLGREEIREAFEARS